MAAMMRNAAMKRAQKKSREASSPMRGEEEWDGGGRQEPTPGGGDEEEGGDKGSDSGEAPDENQLWDWFFGLFKFLLFVSIFTILMVAYRNHSQINAYTALWRSIIAAEYDDFNFIGDVWGFLRGPVLQLLEPDFFSAHQGYWPEDSSQYIYGNRMMGNIRIRQIRVTNGKCSALQEHFMEADTSLQKFCFPPYSKSMDEGKSAKYPHYRRARDLKPLSEMNNCTAQGCPNKDGNITTCCSDFPHFKYRTWQELGESRVDHYGTYNYYPGGGYVVDLRNATDAKEKLDMLERHGWIDLKTRAVFVDFSFYNPNVDLFLVCRILFEFLPSGLVKPQSTYRVVEVNSFSFSDPTTRMKNILLCVLMVLIAWLAYDEVEEIWHEYKEYKYKMWPTMKSHLSDFWNVMDIGTLVVAVFLIYLMFYQFDVVSEMLKDPKNIDSSKLQNMGFWATQATSTAGVQALMLWLKVFKFVAVTHKLEKLFEAIVKSIPAALELLVVYFIFIVAFAVSGLIIFGNDVPLFTDLNVSFQTSIRVALFQDYDWDSMYASNRVLGPVWIILFMLASGIFLINFLVGIFCEVYAEVMGEEAPEGKVSILEAFANKVTDLLQLKKLHARIADIEGRLTDMDADGDGMVSKVELAEFLTKEGAYDLFDATEVTEVMQRFDKDGNGHLSPDEMVELRAALQKRKAQLQAKIEAEEAAEAKMISRTSSSEAQQLMKMASFNMGSGVVGGGGGGGGMEMKMEFRQLREAMDHIQEKADRSAMIEKKMLLALESLTTKIDSLLGRENDFKFLRNNVGQDWMK